MYKTVSIHQHTYQNLQAIALRLEKPKAQVIDELVKGYIDNMKGAEKRKLQEFNKVVDGLVRKIRLPKGTKIYSQVMD